jgi:hypothetical protein
MAVQIEPSQPVLLMRVLDKQIMRGSGRIALQGELIEVTEQERKTYLFWGKAVDA